MPLLFKLLVATAFATLSATAAAEPAMPDLSTRTLRVGAEGLINDTSDPTLVFQHVVTMHNASSIQVLFGRTNLPAGWLLRTTSLVDGAAQHHTSRTLDQWRSTSAWFNGSMVLVEVIAAPQSGPGHISIEGVRGMGGVADDRSICYGVDDRVLSYDDRSARVVPIGCTGRLIDDPARQFLTAGHCMDNPSVVEVMEFNVPLSNGDGSWNHPGPEDQYPIDPVSVQFTDGGIGNDWSYYGCFPNTETGLTAYQAQGVSHVLASAAPTVDGRDITITGYGSTSSPVSPTWYGVQKTHTGPYMHNSSFNVGYQTDTTGGNSGSPVLDELTGLAIGIHTHAGCDGSGGYNNGTAIEHTDLQDALANPLGVCIPNVLDISLIGSAPDAVLPASPFTIQFTVGAGDQEPDPDSIRLVLMRDGVTDEIAADATGADVYEAHFPGFACGDSVQWHLAADSTAGSTVTLPLDAPDTQFHLPIGDLVETVILSTDFDGGLPAGWSASGLWHTATTACAGGGGCGAGSVMYFGQDGDCDYDTGSGVSGSLSSPAVSLDGIAGPYELSFCSHLQTEDDASYDFATVAVNGEQLERAPEGGWTTRVIDLASISGGTATVSFSFDSVDDWFNTYTGWHIDGVQLLARSVECTDPDPCAGDIDGSGGVDTDDLLQLIADWGAAGGPSDIDGDGLVGTDDLLALIAAWGPC